MSHANAMLRASPLPIAATWSWVVPPPPALVPPTKVRDEFTSDDDYEAYHKRRRALQMAVQEKTRPARDRSSRKRPARKRAQEEQRQQRQQHQEELQRLLALRLPPAPLQQPLPALRQQTMLQQTVPQQTVPQQTVPQQTVLHCRVDGRTSEAPHIAARIQLREKEAAALRLQPGGDYVRRAYHYAGYGERAIELSSLRRCVAMAKWRDGSGSHQRILAADSVQQRELAIQLANGDGLQLSGDDELKFLEEHCDVRIDVYTENGVLVRSGGDGETVVSVVRQDSSDGVCSFVRDISAWLTRHRNKAAKRRSDGSFRRDTNGKIRF